MITRGVMTVLLAAGLLLPTGTAAQGLRFATDRNAPLDLEAGRLVWQQTAGRVDISGGVLVQGPLSLSARTMQLTLGADGTPDRLTAAGDVVLVSTGAPNSPAGGRRAEAATAVYDLAGQTLVLDGGVKVNVQDTRPVNLSGESLMLDMRDGRAKLSGGGGTAKPAGKGRARIELGR